jgi:hypothetical protein
MIADPKSPQMPGGGLVEDIFDAVRSEPAAAWFLAQAVWFAQPVMEVFWPRDTVAALAEALESPAGPERHEETVPHE